MIPDFVNGMFEFGGGLIYLINVRRLYRDKQLKGVSWIPVAFFSAWGAWNLFYYPHLNQWWSFYGGLSVFGVNSIWLVMAWYYILKSKK